MTFEIIEILSDLQRDALTVLHCRTILHKTSCVCSGPVWFSHP